MNAYFCAPMKIKILSLFALLSILIIACESDFDLTTDWKEVTVIYGMLNENDDAHYIRVHKAFLDENVSGSEIALIADSVYHEGEIQVDLVQISADGNETSFTCTRVDAADEGFTMDPITEDQGAFATDPYYLYKSTISLDNSSRYRVEVLRNEQVIANSEMGLIGELKIIQPNTTLEPPTQVNLSLNAGYKVRWLYADNGEIYTLNMIMTYREIPSNGDPEEIKELVFPLARNKFPTENERDFTGNFSNAMEVVITKAFFQSHILANIEVNPFVDRDIMHFDFEFAVGGEEIRYAQESAAAQSGITSSQAITIYTNVYQGNTQVEPGAGLFTSQFDSTLNEIAVHNATKDTLHCSTNPDMIALRWMAHVPNFPCQ